eukprot:g52615.t1
MLLPPCSLAYYVAIVAWSFSQGFVSLEKDLHNLLLKFTTTPLVTRSVTHTFVLLFEHIQMLLPDWQSQSSLSLKRVYV